MFVDIDCFALKKYNQNAFGDYFVSKRKADEERVLAVLSDGLGSGIKANILACMTATMLLRFTEEDVPLKKAAEIIMNALPVCKVRKISYATFSGVDCDDEGNVRIVEEGNPDFIFLSGENVKAVTGTQVASASFPNRHMNVYQLNARLGDRLIFCSDGVTQAGLGRAEYPLGWTREGLMQFVQQIVRQRPEISSTELARRIVLKAKSIEVDEQPMDDISAVVLYFRNPRESLIFTGPPFRREKDHEYALTFDNFIGKKAICGGTTANLIARELGRSIDTPLEPVVGNLPSVSEMDGVDLVTEGILTLTRALEYLENGQTEEKDAAGQLVNFLLDSDVIEFMLGATLNQAHYDPTLPIEIEIRRNVIKKMKTVLEDKYLKKVTIHYI